MNDEPSVKMTLHIAGQAVEITPRHSLVFEQAANLSIVPVLLYNGKRVKERVRLLMNVTLPGEK